MREGSGHATLGTLALTRATPHGDSEGSVLAGMWGVGHGDGGGEGPHPPPLRHFSVVIFLFPVLLAYTTPLPPVRLPEMISRPALRWKKKLQWK